MPVKMVNHKSGLLYMKESVKGNQGEICSINRLEAKVSDKIKVQGGLIWKPDCRILVEANLEE